MRMNRVRTSLTLLGIVIGVASVIVMLAIGEGARRKVVEQMGTMGTAILYMGSKPPASGLQTIKPTPSLCIIGISSRSRSPRSFQEPICSRCSTLM